MKKNEYLYPEYEKAILQSGAYMKIVGIDEVGRGCWAGPVAVGAYIFTAHSPFIHGVRDSKLLSEKKRSEIHGLLSSHTYEVSYASASEIDELGIGGTIEYLIATLIQKLQDDQTLFLIDGQFSRDFGRHTRKIIQGDRKHYSIGAASILAKVERDGYMQELDCEYPEYGFAIHKGYGTQKHRDMLAEFGPCTIHRKSYKPIAMLL